MPKPMNISEARTRLPELARRVSARVGAVEYIEHRDLPDDLALTSASYIAFLETTVAELRKLKTTKFVVEGTIHSDLSDEHLAAELAQMKSNAGIQADSKMREFAK